MGIPRITFAGGGERAQYLTHKSNDTTIRFVLSYPGLLDPTILCAATKRIVDSVDILHSSFFVDSNAAYWKENGEMDENNYFHFVYADGDPFVVAKSLSVYPVYHEDKTQIRCELVQNDSASAVVLCISHLCADGVDGKYLLLKLIEAYNLILEFGSAESLVIKNGSRAPEQVYENTGLKDIKDMLRLPISTTVTSSYPFPTGEKGMCRVITSVIRREVMSSARKKAKEVSASANDLLLAATYHVYANLPEIDRSSPISISSMMDLRRHCKEGESEGLCNMSGMLPTSMPNGVSEDFENTLTEIAKQTNAAKEDPIAGLVGMPLLHTVARTLPVWFQMSVIAKAYGAMPVGLTNLGNMNCSALTMGGLIPTHGVFGGPVKKKPGMQISIISFDGECVLACYGQFTATDAQHIQQTLDAICKAIADYASS